MGALAALLIAYHPRFVYLYYDTAYIYDVLCYFFYFATLLLYVRVRQQHRVLNGLGTCRRAAAYSFARSIPNKWR